MTVSESCLIKLLPYVLFEKYAYILALEMASPGNQHCVSCIGTLSFPIRSARQPSSIPSQEAYELPQPAEP